MSTLSLNNVIVHELIKKAKEPISSVEEDRFRFRDTELNCENATVQRMINEINSLYGKSGNSAQYGIFKEEETERGPVPDAIIRYIGSSSRTTQMFIDLSVEIMKKLGKEAEKQVLSSGGVIVFADYIRDGVHFFLITMIKQKEGIRLSANMEPELLEQLELSKINQAARINFDRFFQYQNSPELDKHDLSYLSFIGGSSSSNASGYFITALGCDKGVTANRATKNLPKEVRAFFMKHPELKDHAKKFKNEVLSYLAQQLHNKKPARLSDIRLLSLRYMASLEDDKREKLSEDLVTHLNSEEVRIPNEFSVSASGLKSIMNIKVKGNGYSFDFEKSLLGTNNDADICYNKEGGSLTFTNLSDSAKQLIELALNEKNEPASDDE
ncbi:nucleoid-associated protein [Pantoea dispersa]|uniref:nucleoid-associated protein n=1 Tax=Pantoea dispersa TaxID=59814 RepID=UPI000FDA09E2|nr:nucleoid-associated protein [Pantoea dispersa]MDR6298255.1 nucleoid-associated protein [Pantoea dispersa]RVU75165.1 nucleoid-associated protein [Pantoea dispersa]